MSAADVVVAAVAVDNKPNAIPHPQPLAAGRAKNIHFIQETVIGMII